MARPLTAEERKLKKKEFLEAYEKSQGLQYLSAHKIGVSPQTIDNWRKKDKKFDQAIKDIDERVGDMVVGKLMEKILQGDRASIYFWLKCRKHWHETQKIEVEQTGSIDIQAELKKMKEILNEDDD